MVADTSRAGGRQRPNTRAPVARQRPKTGANTV